MYIMTSNRRPARDEGLPKEEKDFLLSLKTKEERNSRSRQLFEAGWTLRAIGEAYDPPVRRSTVKYWVENGALKQVGGAVQQPNEPKPIGYQRKKPVSPGIPAETEKRLAYLAPIARTYRSGMSSTSLQFQANQEFNEIIEKLYNTNVTTAEIARASNVTFRAIARRLGK
jgi:hypothetical protein